MWNSASNPVVPSPAGSLTDGHGTGASDGQGEPGEVRLERRSLGISHHVCKHLMGMWRGQARLCSSCLVTRAGVGRVQRSWQPLCPVLPWDVFAQFQGAQSGFPLTVQIFQPLLPGWDRGAGEILYSVLNALIKCNNYFNCPLFPGRGSVGSCESSAELPHPSRNAPAALGSLHGNLLGASLSAQVLYISLSLALKKSSPLMCVLSEDFPAAGAVGSRGAIPDRALGIRCCLWRGTRSYRSTLELQPEQKLGLSSSLS